MMNCWIAGSSEPDENEVSLTIVGPLQLVVADSGRLARLADRVRPVREQQHREYTVDVKR